MSVLRGPLNHKFALNSELSRKPWCRNREHSCVNFFNQLHVHVRLVDGLVNEPVNIMEIPAGEGEEPYDSEEL